MTKPCTYCRYERIDAADPHTVYDCLTRALDQRDAAELQLNAMRQERDDEREISKGWEEKAHESNRLIDELKDKASVAAVILKQYVEGSGIPLERSVIARQLIETFEKLTERPKCDGLHTNPGMKDGKIVCYDCGHPILGKTEKRKCPVCDGKSPEICSACMGSGLDG